MQLTPLSTQWAPRKKIKKGYNLFRTRCISSSMCSIHFFLGLPLFLLPVGFHSSTLLGILFPSIRITWPTFSDWHEDTITTDGQNLFRHNPSFIRQFSVMRSVARTRLKRYSKTDCISLIWLPILFLRSLLREKKTPRILHTSDRISIAEKTTTQTQY